MKKFLFFLLFAVSAATMFAQTQCRVNYSYQRTSNVLQVNYLGHAWNTDSSQISITHWEWSFGDGGTATTSDPSHTYTRAGTYNVCVYITTSLGCTSHYCDSITVGPNTLPCLTVISHQAGQNNDVYFNGYSSNNNGGTNPASSYYWSFGDGTTGTTQDPHHIYAQPGTYHICLTIITTANCSNTSCIDLVVGSNTPPRNCAVNYTYQNSPTSLTVYFTGHAWSTDSSQLVVSSYTWSFGDGVTGTGTDPHHTYNHAGRYQVCISVHTSLGCISYYCDSVSVGSNPQINCTPSFVYTRDSSNLSIYAYHFIGYEGNIINANTRWEWGFGDGTGAHTRDPHHTYANPGWYYICLYAIDSAHQCYGRFCDSIHIGGQQNIPCLAHYSYQANPQTNQVHFYGYNQNDPNYPQNITSCTWDFGDGTTGNTRDPNHTYYHAGMYFVCLTITTNNNCTSTYCDSISIRPVTYGCQANWSAYRNTNANCPNCFTFVDLSTANHIISREWNFDDGTSSYNQQVVHSFNRPGYYHVCLTIHTADSCTSTYCNYVHLDSTGFGLNHCSVYLTSTTTLASSPTANDGAIDLTVHAGYPPFRYSWSNGAHTEDIHGLVPGYYTVEVHDSLNCLTYSRIHVGNRHDSLGIVVVDTLLTNAIDSCLNFQYQHARVYNIHYISNTVVEITWIFEGNGISSFITETYLVNQIGNHAVAISVRCGTKTLTTYYDIIFSEDLTGISDNQIKPEVTIYPNPVSDVLNILLNTEKTGVVKISLLNAFGQVIEEETTYSGNGIYRIPTAKLANGLYFIRLSLDNNTILNSKFIK